MAPPERTTEADEERPILTEHSRIPSSPALFVNSNPSPLSEAQVTRLTLLKKMFPNLCDWPDEVLLTESIGSLSTAHSNLEIRNGRDHRPSLETRLSHNYKEVMSKEIEVPAGKDNLRDKLHGGRFLPGPLCSLTELWMEARKHIPERGLTQYAHYDVETMGLKNRISSKAWVCLHDPGSVDLNINMFSKSASAVGGASSSKDAPEGLENFKMALSTARAAQQIVTPWNFSITTIQLFLEITSFGHKSFSNQKEHVTQLFAFVNDCMQTNAKNWQLGRPFMDMAALTTQWAVHTSGRPSPSSASRPQFKEKRRRSPSPPKKSFKRSESDGAGRGGICIRYNEERCPNSSENCSFRGTKLRHVCNVSLPGGKRCERHHTRRQHR